MANVSRHLNWAMGRSSEEDIDGDGAVPEAALRCAVPSCETIDETQREAARDTPFEAPRNTSTKHLTKHLNETPQRNTQRNTPRNAALIPPRVIPRNTQRNTTATIHRKLRCVRAPRAAIPRKLRCGRAPKATIPRKFAAPALPEPPGASSGVQVPGTLQNPAFRSRHPHKFCKTSVSLETSATNENSHFTSLFIERELKNPRFARDILKIVIRRPSSTSFFIAEKIRRPSSSKNRG